jgi:hypothetical protein
MKQLKLKLRSRFILLAAFIIYDVAFNFFVDSSSVLHQTLHAIFTRSLFILWLLSWNIIAIEYRFLRIIFIAYFISQIILYLFNGIIYRDIDTWVDNFNNYDVLVFVFIGSTFSAIIYAWRKLG